MKILKKYAKECVKMALECELDLGIVDYYGDTPTLPSVEDILEYMNSYDIFCDAEDKLGLGDIFDKLNWREIKNVVRDEVRLNYHKFEELLIATGNYN